MPRRFQFRVAVQFAAAVGLCLLVAGSGWAQDTEVTQVGWRQRQRICPPGTVPVYPSPAIPSPAETRPPEATPPDTSTPPENALAGDVGNAAGPTGVPNMIGDLPAVLPTVTAFEGEFQSSVPLAGGGGLFKISDNESPIPTDRVFFNYNHFQNALISGNDGTTPDINLETFAFGLEKTFFDGVCSVEFRIPFASGLAALQDPVTGGAIQGTEFGDIPIVFKTLLFRGERNSFSAGLATLLPTARDVRLFPDDPDAVRINNESVHLQPFLGWLWYPGGQLFFQGFAAVDFDVSGSPVIVGGEFAGKFYQQSLLFLDGKLGYWLYQNPSARWLTGIAPTVELHYTSTTTAAPTVGANFGGGITPLTLRQDILDLTAGIQFQLGQLSDLTIAGIAPLRTGFGDKLFDGEFLVQFNRRF